MLEDPWQDPWQDWWPVWNNAKAEKEHFLMELAAWEPASTRGPDERQWSNVAVDTGAGATAWPDIASSLERRRVRLLIVDMTTKSLVRGVGVKGSV